jgi:alginate O-acetyltransferase complex protein AlgI
MAFNSVNFLLFFFTVTLIYYLIPVRFRWSWIVLSSIFFYISFIPVFIFLILTLIIVNYFFAILINRAEKVRKKEVFLLAVLLNTGILAFFKYFDFFRHSIDFSLFDFKILSIGKPFDQWVIPLGLSYFTFTVLSYVIEVKRNNIQPEQHLGIFAAYLLFFPKIAQGPIERPQNLIPQFHYPKKFDSDLFIDGLKQMLWGFFMKLVIADRLALYVNAVYNNSENHNGTTLAVATLLFAFQIYADFSGYTDIALGSAKILGFNLMRNFNRPYFSTSVKEFWSRWHISFSTWLRDYLFLPLAYFFSKKLKNDIYLKIATEKWIYLFATMITFAICGLWHGDGLNFLIWGLLFGFYLTFANWTDKVSNRIRKKINIPKSSIPYKIYAVFVTFILVSFSWIFFRSPNLQTAHSIINKIFTEHGPLFTGSPSILFFSILGLFILVLKEFSDEFFPSRFLLFENKNKYVRVIAYSSTIIMILLTGVFDGGEFIYFQF